MVPSFLVCLRLCIQNVQPIGAVPAPPEAVARRVQQTQRPPEQRGRNGRGPLRPAAHLPRRASLWARVRALMTGFFSGSLGGGPLMAMTLILDTVRRKP